MARPWPSRPRSHQINTAPSNTVAAMPPITPSRFCRETLDAGMALEIYPQARHKFALARHIDIRCQRVQSIILSSDIQHSHRRVHPLTPETASREQIDLPQVLIRTVRSIAVILLKVP